MNRLFGIETEYGIIVEGLGANDWISESIAVVRSYDGPKAQGWNYRGEDARRDMRGFTAQRLSTNPDDAQFDTPGSPILSREEERSDRILSNGARWYNDHGHPEYATPECRSLRDLVAHDKAGERIALRAAQKRGAVKNLAVTLYKNNTDFHGASYGTHEGYLMKRDVPTDALIAQWLSYRNLELVPHLMDDKLHKARRRAPPGDRAVLCREHVLVADIAPGCVSSAAHGAFFTAGLTTVRSRKDVCLRAVALSMCCRSLLVSVPPQALQWHCEGGLSSVAWPAS